MAVVRTEQSGFAFPMFQRDNPMGPVVYQVNSTLRLIQASVRQILMTVPGERAWNPPFGCRAKLMEFDAATPNAKETLCSLVYEALTKWEPRISLSPSDIQVEDTYTTAATFLVIINYTVKRPGFDGIPQSVSVNF